MSIIEKQALIVGAGFSGMCMSIELSRLGVNDHVVLEKDGDVGGTWYAVCINCVRVSF
jgi:cation diffusion facilitator CzcD-associated flavoprotein CzcO